MVALFGPAIGARNSRQEDFGYTALRALAQHKIINTCILSIPLILLNLLSGGRLTGPTTATPANLPSGKVGCTTPPNKPPHKTYTRPEGREIRSRPTCTQHTQHTTHILKQHNRRTPCTNLDSTASPAAGPNKKLPKTYTATCNTQKHLRQELQTAPISAVPQNLVSAPKQSF
jgi:hypothetical protein